MTSLMRVIKPVLFIITIHFACIAYAGPIGQLDSSSRRAVRDAQLEGYGGTTKQKVGRDGVNVQNQVDAKGRVKCIVSVGNVIVDDRRRGNRIENNTIVTGDIVNACGN